MISMKITFDKEADAMYIYLKDFRKAFRTEMVTDDTIMDMDRKGNVIGIELLSVSRRTLFDKLASLRIKQLT
jgi:uncharacterized protein YuzE